MKPLHFLPITFALFTACDPDSAGSGGSGASHSSGGGDVGGGDTTGSAPSGGAGGEPTGGGGAGGNGSGGGGGGPDAELALPATIVVTSSDNHPGVNRTITLSYELDADGRPTTADVHTEHASGDVSDVEILFYYEGPSGPCAPPSSVLAQEHVDTLLFLNIGGCPSSADVGGLLTEYTYEDGVLVSASSDWGVYGTGVLDVQASGGVVQGLDHDYPFGVTSMDFQPNGETLAVSGFWDADGAPAASPFSGIVEFDASGRRSRVEQTSAGGIVVEVEYAYR